MHITTHPEDILPEVSYDPGILAALASKPEAHPDAVVATAIDLSGSIAIFGPIVLGYDLNLSAPSASISLEVFGHKVASGEITPDKPCLSFKGDYHLAKWDLNVCLRLAEKRISLEGKACVSLRCKSFDVTVFQWGQVKDSNLTEDSVVLPARMYNLSNISVSQGGVVLLQCSVGLDSGRRITLPLAYSVGVPAALIPNHQYTITATEDTYAAVTYQSNDGTFLHFRY